MCAAPLLAAAPASAQSPIIPPNSSVGTGGNAQNGVLQWNDGTVEQPTTFSCIPSGHIETLGGAWVSWYGALNTTPVTNQVFYVRVSWAVTGFPCGTGSAYVAPEFALPVNTEYAISQSTPVRCWVKLSSNHPYQEFSRSECPQAPTGRGQGGGQSFNPTDGSGAWPTASGTFYEIWAPVKATGPIVAAGGGNQCPNCLWGGVKWIDGSDNPYTVSKAFVYTGSGSGSGSGQPEISYPVPATLKQSGCASPNQNKVTTWTSGIVDTRGTTGVAKTQIAFASDPNTFYDGNASSLAAGAWRIDQCWLFGANSDPLPPDNYRFRVCYDPAGSAPLFCGPAQDFTVASTTPDTTPPNTEIREKPAATTDGSNDRFTFKSSEPNSTFECKLDSAAYSACLVLTLKDLPEGAHTLLVRAKDPSGNVDQSPASYTWTVDRPDPPDPGPTDPGPTDPGPTDPGPTQPSPGGGSTPTPPVQPPILGGGGPTITPPKQCVVPKLKGKTLAQAKKALTKANCKLGKVTKKKVGRKVKAGRVLSFKPAAGKKLANGAKVALIVGRH